MGVNDKLVRLHAKGERRLRFSDMRTGVRTYTDIEDWDSLELAKFISNDSFIHYLSLIRVRFTAYGYGQLSDSLEVNNTIRRIDFSGTKFTTSTIRCLNLRRPNIKMIGFEHCGMTDEIFRIILTDVLSLESIVELHLSDNEITCKGIQLFIDILPKCVHLKKIRLVGNPITCDDMCPLIKMIPQLLSIESIHPRPGWFVMEKIIDISHSIKTKIVVYLLAESRHRGHHIFNIISKNLIREIFMRL